MAKPEERIYEGLAQVAHAIRRSTAYYLAFSMLDPTSTVDDLEELGNDIARRIGGMAQKQDEEEPQPRQPLGEPWPPRE